MITFSYQANPAKSATMGRSVKWFRGEESFRNPLDLDLKNRRRVIRCKVQTRNPQLTQREKFDRHGLSIRGRPQGGPPNNPPKRKSIGLCRDMLRIKRRFGILRGRFAILMQVLPARQQNIASSTFWRTTECKNVNA